MTTNSENFNAPFNIKEFLIKALNYKYFYIISFVVFLGLAFMINKFSPVVYQVNSVIGPIEERSSSFLSSENIFSSVGAFPQSRNLENDINSLSSFSLVSKTLKKLNNEIGYYKEDNNLFWQENQLYNNSPIVVTLDKSHNQAINTRFYINIIDNTSYRLTSEGDDNTLYNYVDNTIISHNNVVNIDTICRFNETISNNRFKFSISLNKDILPANHDTEEHIYFELYHFDYLTSDYLERLIVEPVSMKSSLINVSFQGENLGLTIEFLNKYLETYVDENLAKKNKIAINTVNFIDSQISEMADSLVVSESELRDYRSANQVTDLSYQGQRALEQMAQIENDLSTLQVQEGYYNYVLDYFSKNQDMASLAPPSVANVVDPIMNTLILELLTLNAERSTILSNNAEKNLFLGQIENKIRLQKQAIIENVTNNLNTLTLRQNELDYRSEKLTKEISKLPRTELNMVSMQRKFNLSDAIYTFLLQKRSEAAITMASNYPDHEILEPAREISKTILSPKTTINYLLALFLAFLLPSLFIILKDFFNESIAKVSDVESYIGGPVMSQIYSNYTKTEAVVPELPGSYIAESFRNLRTNLLLKLRPDSSKTILITSSQPKDGKSFISFNLAASIASVGHKTVIVDCDLRRPTLHQKFKMENDSGLSTYIAKNTSKDKIILKTNIDNLYFIPAGPISPNSSEIIEAGGLDKLINDLKEAFDYVIIDTTPTGLVADATLMIKYASHVLLVCRNNYTRKDIFIDALNLFRSNNIENFDVVFNDLNFKKSRYGRYNAYYNKD